MEHDLHSASLRFGSDHRPLVPCSSVMEQLSPEPAEPFLAFLMLGPLEWFALLMLAMALLAVREIRLWKRERR